MITTSINYYRSTYFEIDVNVEPPEGMTATKALFTVKPKQYDDEATDATAIVKKDVSLTGNSGAIAISDTDIADTVEPGKYYYSINVVMSDGNPYPFAMGRFDLRANTTNRSS